MLLPKCTSLHFRFGLVGCVSFLCLWAVFLFWVGGSHSIRSLLCQTLTVDQLDLDFLSSSLQGS